MTKKKLTVVLIISCVVMLLAIVAMLMLIKVKANEKVYLGDSTPQSDHVQQMPAETEPKETEPKETEAPVIENAESSNESELEAEDVINNEEVEGQKESTEDNENATVSEQKDVIIVGELMPDAETDYPDDGEIVYTTHWVNVRKEPSVDGEVIGKLEENERIFRFETKSGWSKIFYNNGVGYIYNQYIDSQKIESFDLYTEVDETVYSGHNVNIRLAPSIYSPSLGKLKHGESIRRIGVGKNGWSQVMYKNQLVYINSTYLSTDPNFVIPIEWFLEQEKENSETNGQKKDESTGAEAKPEETKPETGTDNGETKNETTENKTETNTETTETKTNTNTTGN